MLPLKARWCIYCTMSRSLYNERLQEAERDVSGQLGHWAAIESLTCHTQLLFACIYQIKRLDDGKGLGSDEVKNQMWTSQQSYLLEVGPWSKKDTELGKWPLINFEMLACWEPAVCLRIRKTFCRDLQRRWSEWCRSTYQLEHVRKFFFPGLSWICKLWPAASSFPAQLSLSTCLINFEPYNHLFEQPDSRCKQRTLQCPIPASITNLERWETQNFEQNSTLQELSW